MIDFVIIIVAKISKIPYLCPLIKKLNLINFQTNKK